MLCLFPECRTTNHLSRMSPEMYDELLRGIVLFSGLDPSSPCDQSPTVGSTTDSPDEN